MSATPAEVQENTAARGGVSQRRAGCWRHVLATAMISLFIASLAAVAITQEKQRYRERATLATQNMANSLGQQVIGIFDKVDVVLRAGVHLYQKEAGAGRIGHSAIDDYLAHQAALLPEVDSLRILDRNGRVRFSSGRIDDAARLEFADRAYFKRARDDAAAGLVVDGPLQSRINGRWIIVLARRLESRDGQFLGVLYAGLDSAYFEKVLGSVRLGAQGAATLRMSDLALVHRVPDTRGAVGTRKVSSELAAAIAARPAGGDYIAATAIDGIERSNAYRRLDPYPFYVIVGLATIDYLDGWVRQLVLVIGLAGLAILTTALASWQVFRSQRRLHEDIRQRIAIGAELERSLVERARLNSELEVRARQAEAANQAKSAFLANMSHEMRTPLHQINGLAQLLRRSGLSVAQGEKLDKLDSAAHHLGDLVNGILELTRIEAGQLQLAEVPVDLPALLNEVQGLCRGRASERGLRLDVVAPPAEAGLVGDLGYIRSALLNYLDNALRFTERGGITLLANCLESDERGALVRFEVADTGSGIAPEVMPRLFNIFEQGDNSTTRRHGGTGLGLAMTRKIARLLGGDAGCTSTPGEGSCFWFTVRLRRVLAAAQAPTAG